VLVHQIESDLHRRQGKAVTNFQHTLPDPQSELAASLLKDPYSFDFLSLTEKAREQDLERDLLHNIRSFLLELGTGFAFVGSQHHLEVGGRDYFLDLLFYHLRLRCYVIIELKIGEFEPEHAGKMNFYLAAVDALLRHPTDSPSIGMILCKTKNKVVVEYALQHANRPMGVATYRVARALPPSLRGELPSPRELEKRLSAAPSADAAAIAGEIAESEADSDR
jgi:predicted nuclease of restriction endonuclease-like (RecB) superfamily